MAEAYCVKDKKKVEVVNPQRITMKNGKPRSRAPARCAAARSSRSAADDRPFADAKPETPVGDRRGSFLVRPVLAQPSVRTLRSGP